MIRHITLNKQKNDLDLRVGEEGQGTSRQILKVVFDIRARIVVYYNVYQGGFGSMLKILPMYASEQKIWPKSELKAKDFSYCHHLDFELKHLLGT